MSRKRKSRRVNVVQRSVPVAQAGEPGTFKGSMYDPELDKIGWSCRHDHVSVGDALACARHEQDKRLS